MSSKEIFVGNFFLETNKFREKLDDKFINILLIGGSAGSLELNNKMLDEIKNLDKKYLKKIKFFIQIPNTFIDYYKKKYENLISNKNFLYFHFKNNLNFKEYDFILSRSGSGSINEILYFTDKVYFIPHLVSRDHHQKFNLSYFLSHNMSLRNFVIPTQKKIMSQFYFNSLINPHSIEKIVCYTTR